MGCPDWPKCFGSWIPPLHESDLPKNYQEIYSHRGYADTTFNAVKTWTEYFNRLSGVLVGILIIITWVLSFPLIKKSKKPLILSTFLLALVIFQGWLGAMVVKSNLTPWVITLHMFLALILIATTIYTIENTKITAKKPLPKKLNAVLIIAIIAIGLQILLGTDVREHIDMASKAQLPRTEWISYVSKPLATHAIAALGLLLLNIWVGYELITNRQIRSGVSIIGITITELFFGIVLSAQNLPPYIQPLHLMCAILLFGVTLTAYVTQQPLNDDE
jgi:cytochrome c oxidase assembly protein subunit 15